LKRCLSRSSLGPRLDINRRILDRQCWYLSENLTEKRKIDTLAIQYSSMSNVGFSRQMWRLLHYIDWGINELLVLNGDIDFVSWLAKELNGQS
jgi:hypothetical protein